MAVVRCVHVNRLLHLAVEKCILWNSPSVGTWIPIFFALDPKTLPKTRNSEVCNSKTGKTG
jgi:hypothetical protein